MVRELVTFYTCWWVVHLITILVGFVLSVGCLLCSTMLLDFFFLFDARPVANWCFIYLCAVTSPPWWVCVQHPVLEYNAVIYQAEL